MKRTGAGPKSDASLREALEQALAYARQGQWLGAEGLCQVILEARPDHLQARQLIGELCFAQGRFEEALAHADHALALRPRDAETLYNRGTVLAALGRHADALADLDQALALRPRDAAALVNRGNVLAALGRRDEALASLDAALAIEPKSAEAHYNRGNALLALGRCDESVAAFDRALALGAGNVDALVNRGNALYESNRCREALASFDEALARAPGRADVHYNRGTALRALERDREALAAFERAIAVEPQHVDARWNLALTQLLLGDYANGFAGYEWRWKLARAAHERRDFDRPLWHADARAAGKTVLLRPEQGFGDTIQFLRYVPQVAARCARVVLMLQRPLVRLCAPLAAHAQLVAEDEPVPAHDFQCPMGTLPHAFGTTLETIPDAFPYLSVDAALLEQWRERLAPEPPGIKVGLAWAGNPRQLSEPRRGVGLDACAPLLEVQGVRWVSLQVGARAADVARVPRGSILDVSQALGDFAETAALIANLDLVVTSDTAVAHLAGALGKPVWVLLMHTPDWRWMRSRADNPWYPSARLFRQARIGDWPSAVAQARRALEALVAGGER